MRRAIFVTVGAVRAVPISAGVLAVALLSLTGCSQPQGMSPVTPSTSLVTSTTKIASAGVLGNQRRPDESCAAEPVPATPPVVGDAPPVEAGTPIEGATGEAVVCTPDTRQPMCTREYRPVCGTLEDNSSKTYGNKCTACSDAKVVRYVDGKCPGDAA